MKREVVRTRRRAERESLGLGLDIEEDGGMEGLVIINLKLRLRFRQLINSRSQT